MNGKECENELCGLRGVRITCKHHKKIRLETYQPVPGKEYRMLSKGLRVIALDRIRLILYYRNIGIARSC